MNIADDHLYKLFTEPTVLNIFCDASLRYRGKYTDICYGAIAVCGDHIIDGEYKVISDCSCYVGEMYAIVMGLYIASRYRNTYPVINIFSDSESNINLMKSKIFKCNLNEDGLLVKGQKKIIKYTDAVMEAISIINQYDLSVNFFYQKGHVDTIDKYDIVYAMSAFSKFNHIICRENVFFIKYISSYNNMVDYITRETLYRTDVYHNRYIKPFSYISDINIIKEYEKRKEQQNERDYFIKITGDDERKRKSGRRHTLLRRT